MKHLNEKRVFYVFLLVGFLANIFAGGQYLIPLAVWIMPVGFLGFLNRQEGWRGFFITWAAFSLSLVIAFLGAPPPPMPLIVQIGVIVGIGTLLSLAFLFHKLFYRRIGGLLSTLIFPAAFTSIEFLIISFSPYGSIGSFAYSLWQDRFLFQLVSVTGLSGVTFLIMWFASLFNYCLEQARLKKPWYKGALIFTGVFIVVLGYGASRVGFYPPRPESCLRVAIVTGEPEEWYRMDRKRIESDLPGFREQVREYNNRLFELTRKEAAAGAKIIAWSEMAGVLLKSDEAAFLERGRQIAREFGLYLAMGLEVIHPGEERWQEILSVFIGPEGKTAARYRKGKPIAGFEADAALLSEGVIPVVETEFGKIALTICNDNNFTAYINQLNENEPDLMINHGYHFYKMSSYSLITQNTRAIEHGFTVLNAVGYCTSVILDPYGRNMGTLNYYSPPQGGRSASFSIPMPERVFTFYSVTGDLFAWLTMGLLVYLILLAVRKKGGE